MWFFKSPEIVHGEEALNHLEQLEGKRAHIITDTVLVKLGHVDRVRKVLESAGFQVAVFDGVEPDPSLETVHAGAAAMTQFGPDWIVALGGGSCIDAAKAMWILYERPDVDPEGINPIENFHLRRKAHLVAIPTTSGTGSESTWIVVLTNRGERRKLGLGTREAVPDLAIIDPSFVMDLPPRITADTGMDALTHAVEGYTCVYHNDFTDGLCLRAAQMVFEFLPRAYKDGHDAEARLRMHNAASIAGLGFGNSMASLAHGMGHSLGAVFHIPHGRGVSLCLPYVIEFCARGDTSGTRYGLLASGLGLPAKDEVQAAAALAAAIRDLQVRLDQPRSLRECGVSKEDLGKELALLVSNTGNDSSTVTSTRGPDDAEVARLFEYMYEGRSIDF
jgi:alcohol dehydrogenase class IV